DRRCAIFNRTVSDDRQGAAMIVVARGTYIKVVAVLMLSCWANANPAWAEAPEQHVFEIPIKQGRVPKDKHVIRVKQADHVKLRWTSDESVTLHLHGYDIEKKVRPGVVTEFAFEAYAAGRFPLNVHGSSKHGNSHHESTLVYIEVHPR
ncbi:MAG: hypothetical protein ACE5LB_14640, partial [Acidiferrobacterales bacterium]